MKNIHTLMILSLTIMALGVTEISGEKQIHEATATAKVTGYAADFVTSWRLKHYNVTWLETGISFQTDSNGRFEFYAQVGSSVTLFLEGGLLYHPTQTSTLVVPPEGFQGSQHEITLQVPDIPSFKALNLATGLHAKSDA